MFTDNFTTISLREFQLHASKYIDKLPIVLTKYNKAIAIVTKHDKPGILVDFAEEEKEIPTILREPVRELSDKVYPVPKPSSKSRK